MRVYARDEYENWDEYEDDEEKEDGGNDGFEEEAHKPTREESDYLAMRQKLKESIRKQMKDTGTANSGSRDKVNALRKDNYGSFFGPSQPIISQRVIQESKSLLENPDLAARFSKTSHKEKKISVSAPVSSKSQVNHPPRVANGLKKKSRNA